MVRRLARWARREWPVLLIVGLGVVIQLFLITRPLSFLLAHLLPDDAFYYFQVAQHILAGQGPTFDGISPTNGYHPLWLLVLLPIFKFFGHGAHALAPIRVALALCIALNAGTALVVARLLSRFTSSRSIRSYGVLVWVLNPFLLYQGVNGLETSLSLFLFSIFFLLVLGNEEGSRNASYPRIGAIGGLMVLARLDMAFYLVAFLLWVLARYGWRAGWKEATKTGVAAGVFIVPFVLWNVLNFHMLLTAASNAAAMVNHQLIAQDHGASLFQTLKAIVYTTQYELVNVFQRTGMLSLSLGLLGAGITLVILGVLRMPRRLAEISCVQALSVGALALFIADASVRWTAREWYFVSFDIFLAIGAVVVLDALFPRIRYKRTIAAVLCALTLFSFYVDWSKELRADDPAPMETYAAALWMNANLPPGTMVGVFNAGVQAYFSDMQVVNLDGLINNDAYRAMQRRQLWAYVLSTRIAYISDFDLYLTYRYKSFLGADPFADLTLIKTFGDVGAHGQGGLNIYRVK